MCASSRPPDGEIDPPPENTPPPDDALPPRAWDAEADEWLVAQAVAGSRFSGQAFETLLRRHQHASTVLRCV